MKRIILILILISLSAVAQTGSGTTASGSMFTEYIEAEYIFEPVEYFDFSGRKVKPTVTGLYIASDGYIRKIIYITKN